MERRMKGDIMHSYAVYLAACSPAVLDNRSFVTGCLLPNLLKAKYKSDGFEAARDFYLSCQTEDMPNFEEAFASRVRQKERFSHTSGMHFGRETFPHVNVFWGELDPSEKNNPFWKGYLWHLITDAIVNFRLGIEEKLKKCLDNQFVLTSSSYEVLQLQTRLLSEDWNKVDCKLRLLFPYIEEVPVAKDLNLFQTSSIERELMFLDWDVMENTLTYLRSFNPFAGHVGGMIEEIMTEIR